MFNVDLVRLFHKCIHPDKFGMDNMLGFKEVRHIEMPKAASKKSICHFQKLQMILK